MKNLFFLMTCACLMLGTITYANNTVVAVGKHVTDDFKKSKTGIWEGQKDGKTYWYKLDKSARLWWSADGKKWEAATDAMWADKDGKWLKINDKKLVWSADNGASWAEVPDWKWEGPKGQWYKFDKSWGLWEVGGKMM